MKKLLGILGTITIAGSGISGIVGNAPAPAKKEINYLQTNNLEKLNRNKRNSYPNYNYDNPDLKTMDGFLKNLVVIINNDKLTRLKSNYFKPEYALSLPDNRFEPGQYDINGITLVSNEVDFIPTQTIPVKEDLIHSQKTEFKAGNQDEDKALSGSFAYNVTDSFSFKFGQKLSIKTGLKVKLLASFEITGELSTEETWTKTNSYTIDFLQN